jgi:hypothetical protein
LRLPLPADRSDSVTRTLVVVPSGVIGREAWAGPSNDHAFAIPCPRFNAGTVGQFGTLRMPITSCEAAALNSQLIRPEKICGVLDRSLISSWSNHIGEIIQSCDSHFVMTRRRLEVHLLMIGIGVLAAACNSPMTSFSTKSSTTTSSAIRTTSSVPSTSSVSTTNAVTTSTVTTSTTEPPTLGVSNPMSCTGCGMVEPVEVKVLKATSQGSVTPEVDFSGIQWQGWGSQIATASVNAYFTGPGEYAQQTLTAFSLGTCGNTYGYRALEWTSKGQTFSSTTYFDTCMGQYAGHG